jgi:chromosome segregation ATPase
MIPFWQALLMLAGVLALTEWRKLLGAARWLWNLLPRKRLLDEFRAMEAQVPRWGKALNHGAEMLQPIVQQAETEYKTVRDDLQQKFAAVGAKLTEWKARATTAEQSAADLKAQLDAANAHIAELTAQDAEVESAVAALADQAGG